MVEAVFRLAMEAMLLADDDGRYIRVNPAASELTGYSVDELLAMTVFDLTPLQIREDGLATWREFLRNGKMSGEYSLVRKDGSIVVVEFCAVAGIRPGVHLSILHDVTARVRLERRVRLAASFQEATAALNAAVDVEQVAAVVLSTGLTSLGARAGHLVMIGDDGWAEVVAQAGVDESDESHWAISCRSLGVAHDRVDGRFRFAFDTRSVLHRAFERGGPIGIQRVVDLDVDPRVQQGLSRLGTAMSCIPLVVSGRLIGGLYLYWPARDDFSDEERYCASTLAAMGAQSLDRARLHAQVKAAHRTAVATADRIMDQQSALEHMAFDRVMVEERERRRIATALHDGVGQYLALAKMALDPVRRRVDGEHGEALTRCLGLVEAAIEEARSLTFDLSPPMLYELGLAPALSALGEKLAETTGLGVDVAADDGALDLDEVTAVIVFRSVRELLMNVVKHSGSASARVRLAREAGRLSVAVEDAGRGFDLAKVTSKRRFGLMSVHEQIVRLGGAVDVTSGPAAPASSSTCRCAIETDAHRGQAADNGLQAAGNVQPQLSSATLTTNRAFVRSDFRRDGVDG